MFDWLKDRLKEPTTWLGLGGIAAGVNQAFDVNELGYVAEAAGQAGQAVAAGADPWTAGILAVAGLLGAVLREKGRR